MNRVAFGILIWAVIPVFFAVAIIWAMHRDSRLQRAQEEEIVQKLGEGQHLLVNPRLIDYELGKVRFGFEVNGASFDFTFRRWKKTKGSDVFLEVSRSSNKGGRANVVLLLPKRFIKEAEWLAFGKAIGG